jgi:hypothetical protein
MKTRVAIVADRGLPGEGTERLAYRVDPRRSTALDRLLRAIWVIPDGKRCNERDERDFERFARGEIDATQLGIPSARLVLESIE